MPGDTRTRWRAYIPWSLEAAPWFCRHAHLIACFFSGLQRLLIVAPYRIADDGGLLMKHVVEQLFRIRHLALLLLRR